MSEPVIGPIIEPAVTQIVEQLHGQAVEPVVSTLHEEPAVAPAQPTSQAPAEPEPEVALEVSSASAAVLERPVVAPVAGADDSDDSDEADLDDDDTGEDEGVAGEPRPVVLGPDGLPIRKKRRRGKRGGKNRNRKPVGEGGEGASGDDASDDDENLPDSWNDAAADRGMTSDDALEEAREDAGLVRTKVQHPTPANAGPGSTTSAAIEPGDVHAADSKDGDDNHAPFLKPAVPPPAPKLKADADSTKPEANSGDGADGSTTTGEPGAPGSSTAKKRRRRGGKNRNKKPASASGAPAGNGQSGPKQAPGNKQGFIEGVIDDDEYDGAAFLETLDEKTLERRRGLQRKGRPTGRYVMAVHTHQESGRSHVAVLEGRNLVEHYVAEVQDDERTIDGNIYWGKVQNVQPGMEAAFVDIGTSKNAILYRGDVKYDDDHDGDKPKIERMLRNGQSILVQVTKNPIMHKGARLTQDVSLAGRFVVMVPDQPGTYGISKRLPDDERKRLRRVLDRLRPANAGLIVRTAAEGATEDELERDMKRLQFQWNQIDKLRQNSKPGTLLYKEPPLAIRVIREEFTKEYRAVVIDDRAMYEEVKGYIDAVAPELSERVEFYDAEVEGFPLFERFHVHEQLHKALDKKVWLPSGGSLVIEHTEALTVIDVNTAKNVGKNNLEETVYRNNLEAADVIARELRLRDIGGIIVIDFIDMEIKANRENVERTFREALARDKTRTQIYPISDLGLLEMTRKRVSEGLIESFSQTCDHCEGRGFLIDRSSYEE